MLGVFGGKPIGRDIDFSSFPACLIFLSLMISPPINLIKTTVIYCSIKLAEFPSSWIENHEQHEQNEHRHEQDEQGGARHAGWLFVAMPGV